MLISGACTTDVHLGYNLNGNYKEIYQQILLSLLIPQVFIKNICIPSSRRAGVSSWTSECGQDFFF